MGEQFEKVDLIVVGAGLVGSAFALLMAEKTDLKITVVERAKALQASTEANQRVVALGEAATNVLAEVGVFQNLSQGVCHPYQRMHVWDENSDGELDFCAKDYQRDALGYLIDSLECTRLLQAKMLEHPQVSVHYEFSAEGLEILESEVLLSGIRLTESVATTSVCSAPLLVAGDGNRSWARQQAKIFTQESDYGQRGIVAKIHTELSHQDTAWQRFLHTGPVAVLPLAGNQSSIVWSADNARADELMTMDDTEFCISLADALEGQLGDVELVSKRAAFPLKSQRADTYFKRRFVLIGDAAHSIHPLAGQGANLGFKDAASLANVLSSKALSDGNSENLGELPLLQQYQRARKLDNQQTDLLMSALHRAYQNQSPWWLAARGAGMNWISKSETLKQLLAKQAMGI